MLHVPQTEESCVYLFNLLKLLDGNDDQLQELSDSRDYDVMDVAPVQSTSSNL